MNPLIIIGLAIFGYGFSQEVTKRKNRANPVSKIDQESCQKDLTNDKEPVSINDTIPDLTTEKETS